MSDQPINRLEVQSFVLRLTRNVTDDDWHVLLKPIDGSEPLLFADVATFAEALTVITVRHNPTAPQPDRAERRLQ